MIVGIMVLVVSVGFLWASVAYNRPIVLLVLMHNMSMYASSFVEEEHEFWFYMFAGVSIYLAIQQRRLPWIIIASCSRLLYMWNPKGIKYNHLNENMRHLLANYPVSQTGLLVLSLAAINAHSLAVRRNNNVGHGLLIFCSIAICIYKLQQDDATNVLASFLPWLSGTWLARKIFVMLTITILADISCKKVSAGPWMLLMVLVARTHNAAVIGLLYLMTNAIASSKLHPTTTLSAVICLIHMAFFATGNTNTIATIDLTNSFIGFDEYSSVGSGILTFLSTFCGPLSVLMAFLCESSALTGTQTLVSFLLFRVTAIANLSIVVTVLRHHLFIWSVFSPKYLYDLVWLTLAFICIPISLFVLVSK